jgi:hypothetical protein
MRHCCCCSAKGGVSISAIVLVIIVIICADNTHTIMQMIDWTLIFTGILVALILAVSVTLLVRSLRRDSIPSVKPVEPLRVVQITRAYSELESASEAILGTPARAAIAAPKAWYEKPVNVDGASYSGRRS